MAADTTSESTTEKSTDQGGETSLGVDGNILAALAYIFNLVGAIVLLVLEDDEYVRFHAAQALLMTGAVVVAQFAVQILGAVLGVVRLGFIAGLLGLAVWAGATIAFVFLAYKAFTGERFEVPYLVDYVDDVIDVF